jgi:tetratricopeptide (TPR) repeat protein
MRIPYTHGISATESDKITLRFCLSALKIHTISLPFFRVDLAIGLLLILLLTVVRARGDDCAMRWQEATKQLDALAVSGDKHAAAQVLHQFVASVDRSDPTCPYLPVGLNRLGSLEQDQGHYESAETFYRRAIKVLETHSDDVELAHALNNLASAYLETGRAKQGEPFRRRSLELRIALFGENNPDVALAYGNFSADLFQEKKYAEAEALGRKALAIWKRVAPDDVRIAAPYASLALICVAEKNCREAVELAEQAVRIEKEKRPDDKPFLARYGYILALAYKKEGRLPESRTAFQEALDYLTAERSPNLALEADVLENYSRLLRQLGSGVEAKTLAERARRLRSEINTKSGLGYSVNINDLPRETKPPK